MALKFRRLSAPQAKQVLRHRVVNSTDLTSSQSSHEPSDAVGQCGHDTRRHSRLQLDTIPASKGILFYTPHLRAELRQTSLSCVFCRNMNSNVLVELELSRRIFGLLLPQIVTCRRTSLQAYSGATSFTGSTFFRSRCLLCENDRKTLLC